MTASPMGSNRDRLIRTAERLGALLAEVVFVGGQMAELLVTDPGVALADVAEFAIETGRTRHTADR